MSIDLKLFNSQIKAIKAQEQIVLMICSRGY